MENLFSDLHLPQIISTVVYSLIGLLFFLIAYYLIEKLTPFSVRKEIEEDQNIALGLIIGLMMVGLAIIIGAAIASPSDPRPARRAPIRMPAVMEQGAAEAPAPAHRAD
jgi:putative membrane protein